ncbi:BTB/POZ domain-containing protein At2g46260-like isoform X2 [Salvia hispanica]|uniref:BTB/POZ domain-containing protein At2g46260-like isoform X2 n=1 Tax=Salvia hispanica TaxID=49212 RepID=UPI00200987C5|nr:BTB/POZ domain-containing protein At2g46260-like isoform X2 [Salvia hispanica]
MSGWGLGLPVMDLSDPTTARQSDFAFAFNDSNFSDRLLRIEIVGDPLHESVGCGAIADWAARLCDLRTRDIVENQLALDVNSGQEERDAFDSQQPDVEDGIGDDNHDEVALKMIEDSPSGDEAANDDSELLEDELKVVRVKTLHISSPILAAKSPFFYKLFSNGMMESEQRDITLRISTTEEAAFMELLNFMYSNTLSINTAPALLDVLMAADKFEVISCIRYCSHQLRNLPMTPESALVFLDLPSSVLMGDAVQPLTDAAKHFLAARYKDVSKYQEEIMNLPLAGIEAILCSDDLQVASEDAVYDLALKWSRFHYQKLEERRDILCSQLGGYIRYPYMTGRKLKKLLTCNDFDRDFATKVVIDALFFKAEAPHRQRNHASEESTSTSRRFVERSYKYRPVKVIEFELPRQQCVVYLDLKQAECANLFPSGRVYSQAFHLGGQGFFLSAHCNMDQQSSFHCFGLFLGMQEKGSVSFGVDYEFAARSKPTEEYLSKYKGNYTFTGGKAVGYRNLFSIPWTNFIAEDSLHFINGILHLRAELTIKH